MGWSMVNRSYRIAFLILSAALGCSSPGGSNPVEKDVVHADATVDVSSGEVTILPTDVMDPQDVLADLPPGDLKGEMLGDDCEENPGQFGCLCDANDDCLSGFCIFHKGERICTEYCTEECLEGFECAFWETASPDPLYLCKSLFPSLCLPCSHSADCLSAGDRCLVRPDGSGSFCGSPCESTHDCEDAGSYKCVAMATTEGDEVSQCAPAASECSCTDYAVSEALGTPCFQENEWGTCGGWRTCTEMGLTTCDAASPTEEICGNEVDEDCDTILDDADVCVICSCDGKECGDDGCGESCGSCPINHVCQVEGLCVCVPNCAGKECGDDGCGTPCGKCDPGTMCLFGVCEDGCENDEGCPALKECVDGFCQPDVPDLVHLQLPVEVATVPGETTVALHVLVHEAGVTEGGGAGDGVAVQVGFGDPAFDPQANPQEWLWKDAEYKAEQNEQGELWTATLTNATSGTYGFTFRVSLDGTHWVYADASGSADGYQAEKLGVWQVAHFPTIESIVPNHGTVLGGQEVTVTGSHFAEGLKLSVDGLEVPATVVDANTITFVSPKHGAGDVSIAVVALSGLGVVAGDDYRYVLRFTPTVDGDLGEWSGFFIVATNDIESNWDPAANHLNTLYASFDDGYLYLAVAGVAEWNNYILGYVDVDFGSDSGTADMLALSDNDGDGDLDDALSNALHVDVAGFGADYGFGSKGMLSFQQGDVLDNAVVVGWRELGLPYDLAWLQGSVQCGDAGCEAAISLATLYGGQVPTALTPLAAFAKLVDRYGDLGGISNQTLPGTFSGDDISAVTAVATFDLWL
jgi:hypothetical protein